MESNPNPQSPDTSFRFSPNCVSRSSTLSSLTSQASTDSRQCFHCSECDQSFTLNKNLKRHEQYSCKKNKKSEKGFKCLKEKCVAAYCRLDGLLSHMNEKHKGDEDLVTHSKMWYNIFGVSGRMGSQSVADYQD